MLFIWQYILFGSLANIIIHACIRINIATYIIIYVSGFTGEPNIWCELFEKFCWHYKYKYFAAMAGPAFTFKNMDIYIY